MPEKLEPWEPVTAADSAHEVACVVALRRAPELHRIMSLPRPAFILGVTGKMRLPGYDPAVSAHDACAPEIQDLRNRVFAVLDWVRECHGALNPTTGEFEKQPSDQIQKWWHSLGIHDTPIVVLSSLAPGADTIVAEAALDYAHERKANVTVRAPLPFPLELYRDASTFCPASDHSRWKPNQDRLDALVERIRAQEGFEESRDLFCVDLDNDLITTAAGTLRPEDDLKGEEDGQPRRYLRYRAAGEYVAAYCDLLLAIPGEDSRKAKADTFDLQNCDTETIVEVKRRGLSFELLAVANNFAWIDSGPVLQLSISGGPMQMLQPYGLKPASVAETDTDNTDWNEQGDKRLRALIEHLSEFNDPDHESETERYEWHTMLLGSRATKKLIDARRLDLLDDAVKTALKGDQSAVDFVNQLREMAQVRHRAAELAREQDASRERLLLLLAMLIGFAALCLGIFEHWHPQSAHLADHSDHGAHHEAPAWIATDPHNIFQACLLLLGTLSALLASAWFYYRYEGRRIEESRFDSRALAEALRVQFYWALSGSIHSVAANYMQRQRSELDWIRCAASSLAFPYERFRRGFSALTAEAQLRLWRLVHDRWIRSQHGWFRDNAPRKEAAAHAWHLTAWGLAGAGLLQVVGMGVAEASEVVTAWIPHHHEALTLIGIVTGISLLYDLWPRVGKAIARTVLGWCDNVGAAIGCARPQETSTPKEKTWRDKVAFQPVQEPDEEDDEKPHGLWRFIFHSRQVWGLALLMGSLIQPLVHRTPDLGLWVPDWHDWWIILTGVLFLAGGLSLAYAERSFFAEHARQYAAMRDLFAAADGRCVELLAEWSQCADGSQRKKRVQLALHDLFYQLGCEALDENAEWLILHRIRPLEPFMAG